MAKKNFFQNIEWVEVGFIVAAILLIDFLLQLINLQISGGFLVETIVLAIKVAIGEGLYETIVEKK